MKAERGAPAARTIDLNCDLGEGAPHDAALLAVVTSANIACGVHAGDEALMRTTVTAAAARGVALGAHPGLADAAGGRGDGEIAVSEAFDAVLEQIRALQAVAAPRSLRHVKPHGALYNRAAQDGALAMAVAAAIFTADPNLMVYGLCGGKLLAAAAEIGLATAAEGFADRGLLPDGRLIPRDRPGALITDPALAAAQAVHLAMQCRDGSGGPAVQTICVHGDTPGAPAIAAAVRRALEQAGFQLAPPMGVRAEVATGTAGDAGDAGGKDAADGKPGGGRAAPEAPPDAPFDEDSTP